MAEGLLKPVMLAGVMLCIMSTVDTLAYGVRTAGVLTRKLAISLSLFNILVIFSRLSNMFSAPILGNLPDKVYQGVYNVADILFALRIDLLFVVAGVVIGAILMPSLIRLFSRGITILEERGSLPRTLFYALRHVSSIPRYVAWPTLHQLRVYSNVAVLPYRFLIYNILVTCFYSIGVMATVLAASIDHSVAGTAILLSGIVNGIATMILFMIVDPPGAVVVEQCISGKRPLSHAKIMNVALVATRLMGTLLALLMLPLMAQYVLTAARWVDKTFAVPGDTVLAQASSNAAGLDWSFKAVQDSSGNLRLDLSVHNHNHQSAELHFLSGEHTRFSISSNNDLLWESGTARKATAAAQTLSLAPGERLQFSETLTVTELASLGLPRLVVASVHVNIRQSPSFSLALSLQGVSP